MDGWKMKFPIGARPIFRDKLLVSGRLENCPSQKGTACLPTPNRHFSGGEVHTSSAICLLHTLRMKNHHVCWGLNFLYFHNMISIIGDGHQPNSRNLYKLLGTNISFSQGMFEDDFPFPKVGHVSSLEATHYN